MTSGSDGYAAFHQAPLPPQPPLQLTADLQRLLRSPTRDSDVSMASPRCSPTRTSLFLYSYVRKEAVLSSQIEGTQSSLSDLLLFELDEAPGVPLDDVVEVSNYVAALEHGLKRVRGGFPISNRLFREIHGVLLSRGRGSGKDPGRIPPLAELDRRNAARPTRRSSRRLITSWRTAWARSRSFFTTMTTACPCSSARDSRTCSSRRFIRSSTATAASDAC